jgi:orotate phosphoribosyltransferase
MMDLRKWRRLLDILRETSFEKAEKPIYRLASGIDSQFYVDCKQALSYPEARGLIGDLIFQLIKSESLDAIGGLEIGAYPIATAVSDKIFAETGKPVRVFIVRKEAKKHGIRNLVAGHVKPGDRTLIVDDVITSGSSAIHAIEGARAAGLTVERVIALVDREESDGRANIEAKHVAFHALFTLAELAYNGDDTKGSASTTDQRRAHEGQPRRRIAAG